MNNEITKLDSKNRTEVDTVIEEVKRELRSVFVKTDEQIKRLGNSLNKVVKREEGICEEIKNALKEEIAEGVISTRTIELHCPPEWKHKTKPKQGENEKISFSKELKEQIVAANQGKSVIYGDTTSNETEILKLEYSLPYQYVQQYMAGEHKEGKSKVWFSVEIDVKSKKIASARTGRISEAN